MDHKRLHVTVGTIIVGMMRTMNNNYLLTFRKSSVTSLISKTICDYVLCIRNVNKKLFKFKRPFLVRSVVKSNPSQGGVGLPNINGNKYQVNLFLSRILQFN